MRQVVHIELPSADAAAAKSFYGDLLGWQPTDIDMGPGEPYTLFSLSEKLAVALAPLGDMVKPGDILLYFGTEDLDADMARVVELGGTVILPREDIPGFGALGIFIDPTGNRLAFWQNLSDS